MPDYAPDFTVTRCIGEGNFGEILLIHCRSFPNHAIVAKKQLAKHSKFVLKEYNIHKELCGIGHENIIGILGRRFDRSFHYLLLEYADRGDFFDMIENLLPHEPHYFFRQLVKGLKFIKDNGVVHRDIKPENLLITGRDILKITDFGFATFTHKDNKERWLSNFLGTKQYKAPEIINQQPYRGSPADVWSACVTLLSAITVSQPWIVANDTSKDYLRWVRGIELNKNPFKIKDSRLLDLLRKMIEPNAAKRITIEQIEEHDWVKLDYHAANKENAPKTQ